MMLTLADIRKGIIRLLREKLGDGYFITGEDADSTEEKPLVHVQLIPLSSETAAAGYFLDKGLFVDISYMEQLVTSNTKIYAMLEEIDSIFKPCFQIMDRIFTCTAQMNVADDIGHYTMTIKFTDAVPFEVPGPAEHLQVDWRE